jgi:hypothetical protein
MFVCVQKVNLCYIYGYENWGVSWSTSLPYMWLRQRGTHRYTINDIVISHQSGLSFSDGSKKKKKQKQVAALYVQLILERN